MDPSARPRPSGSERFPRRRGDGPLNRHSVLGMLRFPPQARGWTGTIPRSDVVAYVSPAGAGMDPWRPWLNLVIVPDSLYCERAEVGWIGVL